jgi:hypothetical protein
MKQYGQRRAPKPRGFPLPSRNRDLLQRILARLDAGLRLRIPVQPPEDHLRLRFHFRQLGLDLRTRDAAVSVKLSRSGCSLRQRSPRTCSSSTEAASIRPIVTPNNQ